MSKLRVVNQAPSTPITTDDYKAIAKSEWPAVWKLTGRSVSVLAGCLDVMLSKKVTTTDVIYIKGQVARVIRDLQYVEKVCDDVLDAAGRVKS